MKVTKNIIKPDFVPVTLNITLENEDDLKLIWALFNISEYNGALQEEVSFNPSTTSTTSVWEVINNELLEKGLI